MSLPGNDMPKSYSRSDEGSPKGTGTEEAGLSGSISRATETYQNDGSDETNLKPSSDTALREADSDSSPAESVGSRTGNVDPPIFDGSGNQGTIKGPKTRGKVRGPRSSDSRSVSHSSRSSNPGDEPKQSSTSESTTLHPQPSASVEKSQVTNLEPQRPVPSARQHLEESSGLADEALRELEAKIAELDNDNDKLVKKNTERLDEIKRLRGELDVFNTKLDESEESKNVVDRRNRELSSEKWKLEKQLKDTGIAFSEKLDRIKTLETEQEKLQGSLKRKTTESAQKEAELASIDNELKNREKRELAIEKGLRKKFESAPDLPETSPESNFLDFIESFSEVAGKQVMGLNDHIKDLKGQLEAKETELSDQDQEYQSKTATLILEHTKAQEQTQKEKQTAEEVSESNVKKREELQKTIKGRDEEYNNNLDDIETCYKLISNTEAKSSGLSHPEMLNGIKSHLKGKNTQAPETDAILQAPLGNKGAQRTEEEWEALRHKVSQLEKDKRRLMKEKEEQACKLMKLGELPRLQTNLEGNFFDVVAAIKSIDEIIGQATLAPADYQEQFPVSSPVDPEIEESPEPWEKSLAPAAQESVANFNKRHGPMTIKQLERHVRRSYQLNGVEKIEYQEDEEAEEEKEETQRQAALLKERRLKKLSAAGIGYRVESGAAQKEDRKIMSNPLLHLSRENTSAYSHEQFEQARQNGSFPGAPRAGRESPSESGVRPMPKAQNVVMETRPWPSEVITEGPYSVGKLSWWDHLFLWIQHIIEMARSASAYIEGPSGFQVFGLLGLFFIFAVTLGVCWDPHVHHGRSEEVFINNHSMGMFPYPGTEHDRPELPWPPNSFIPWLRILRRRAIWESTDHPLIPRHTG